VSNVKVKSMAIEESVWFARTFFISVFCFQLIKCHIISMFIVFNDFIYAFIIYKGNTSFSAGFFIPNLTFF